jgi:hypothetical protein
MAEFVTQFWTLLDILVRKENENGVQIAQKGMFIYSFVQCSPRYFFEEMSEVGIGKYR